MRAPCTCLLSGAHSLCFLTFWRPFAVLSFFLYAHSLCFLSFYTLIRFSFFLSMRSLDALAYFSMRSLAQGNTLHPLELKHSAHVLAGMPRKPPHAYRGGHAEDGKMGHPAQLAPVSSRSGATHSSHMRSSSGSRTHSHHTTTGAGAGSGGNQGIVSWIAGKLGLGGS